MWIMIYKFSASDLVKRSACQIKYLLNNKLDIKASKKQLQGLNHQNKLGNELNAKQEYRGVYKNDNIIIYYCNDLVLNDKIIEVKNVEGKVEDWYFQSSILQTAFYKSLILNSDGTLETPQFRINQGYKHEIIHIDINLPYYLYFGDEKYLVTVKKPKYIINFFYNKAKLTITESYDYLRLYDSKNRYNQFTLLKEYFSYKKI